MGVEKFFNTLLSSYKSKLINTFLSNSVISINADILFFDFNSIIHKISSQIISDLNYLYKILLIASNYPSPKLVSFFENKYKQYEDIFFLSIDFIHTPSGIKQLIHDLKQIDPNVIIIYQIIKTIEIYIGKINNLQLVYLSLDGVPTIGKIMEQRHRRYIGEIINHSISKKINNYKFPKELSDEYPYNYDEYNKTKFSFLKLNISPGTSFMKQLIKSIQNHAFPVLIQINDDSVSGEGEIKIINYIRTYHNLFFNKKIIIYSPDSDMILLSSLLNNDIDIIRFDQQQNQDFILSTIIFKKLLTHYISKKDTINQNLINDIVFIFTIFGDDFLPKLDAIQVNNHYEKVLDIYKNMYNSGYIINQINNEYTINYKQLQKFFKQIQILETPITSTTEYVRKKSSSFNKDPIDGKLINTLNKDIHDSNYLEEKYSVTYYSYPKNEFYKKYNMSVDDSAKEYINGLYWIFNYYFNNKIDYSWYYTKEKAPLIEDINSVLETNYEYKNSNEYPLLFTPIEQAVYTSPINITHVLSKKYQNMTKKFYKKYNLTNILDTIDDIECDNSSYLSKCSLINIKHPIYKLSPKEFIKEFRTESTSNEFIKLVKYYEITNDPFFYHLLEKK